MPDSYKSTEDPQAMTLHASNGTFQTEEHNGEVKADVADDSANNTQSWHVFSHEIRVKMGFPGSESWSQEDGHRAEVSSDTFELEEEMQPQQNGHRAEVSSGTLELEEETDKPSVEANHQQETMHRTIILAEDKNGHQYINSPAQQPVLLRPKHERRSYPTDLTDAQWLKIAPLLPPSTANGHQHHVELREVVNGILYAVSAGHSWGSLPRDLPPRGTVYSYFKRWQTGGALQQMFAALSLEESAAAAHARQDSFDAVSGHPAAEGAAPAGLLAAEAILEETTALPDVSEHQDVSHPVLSTLYDLSVVVPTRNEQDNIRPLLESLREALRDLRVEVIFVDDSDDETPAVITEASRTLSSSQFQIHLEHRVAGEARAGGLATAVVRGMNRAQAEFVAVIDADLQHPPALLRVFYDQAVAQDADLVLASRYMKGGSYRGLAGVGRRFISKGLKWTAKLLFPGQLLRISDPLGGFFLLRRSLLDNVSLRPIGYKILLEILIRCQWRHVLEVPYHFQARAHGQSKATMQQGILALRHMLRLWREVPAAGRVWKISILILLNVLITLVLFIINKSFPWVWANLNIVVFGVMACLDFVLLNRFIFPSPNKASLQRITIPTTPIVDANTDEQFEVMRYAECLTSEAKRNNNGSHQEESDKYTEDALRIITVKGQEFRPFAPFRHALSASKTLTRGQAVILSLIMLGCGLGLLFHGMKTVTVIIALITLLYLSSLLLDFLLTMRALSQSKEEQVDDAIVHALADADWPQYTILCPLYRETEVVPQFVQAMQALDYPVDKLQILFLTEEDDEETRKAMEAMHLPQHFSIVTVPAGQPRTKPRACNFGLLQATGDYVVIYDAEDIPDPLQLKKAVLTFANHDSDLACVQAKLNYYNSKQNLLTRWFTMEYSLWFDLMLPGMQQTKLPLPLGGTSNHFRAEMLRRVGAWDPFNVTEDCDLGLRLARSRLKTIVLDSTTYEEANSQVKNWIRQRSRWIKGYMLTYLVYMRQPMRYLRQERLREFLSLQLVIGGKTAVLFVNPLMWLLLSIYFPLRLILDNVYHTFFPAPILYMSAICLFAGNFFYLYTLLIGGMKRDQYGLIKWALFAPIYWAMMSIAAFMALYQLIFKPHYWEKTKHGLHLRASRSFSGSTTVKEELESVETMLSPAFTSTEGVSPPLPASRSFSGSTTVKEELKSMMAVQLPAFTSAGRLSVRRPKRSAWPQWLKDPWLITTLVIACIASIASCWYSFQNHQILLFEDAFSHLTIARRIFDSLTPGLAQVGGIWLPLPHLLMLPFIWNDYLWRTGLAGSFPSMACYLVTTVYLYLAARRLTRNNLASFVGTLAFILNPNVLYLQTTPLSELACIATMTMTCYYFLAWAQDDHPRYLVFAAGSTCLATLARYDGWILFPTLLVFIVFIGWIRHQQWIQIEGNLIVFGVLGGLGIGLWLLWCAMIFGDPLYFQRGPYSAQAQTAIFLQTHVLETYHNLFQSFRYYTLLCIDTMGPILFLLAALSLVVFVSRRRLAPETLAVLVFLVPFCFYVLSLYSGQANLYVPQVVPANASQKIFNVRFGAEMVAPVALFLAMLAGQWSPKALARHWATIGSCFLTGVIVLQTVLVVHGGIITVQDGQYGGSCASAHPINAYLVQHYAEGRILENIFSSKIDGTEAGIELKDIISEGSGELWKEALNDPASMVDWIIVRPGLKIDPIVTHIDLQSPAFLSRFTLVVQEQDGISLFHRNGRPPLPTRPLPSGFLDEHHLCRLNGSG